MKRIIGVMAVLLLCGPVGIQAQPPQPGNATPGPYVPKPEDTVRSLVSTLNRSDSFSLQLAAAHVAGAEPHNPLFKEVQKELGIRRGRALYSINDIESDIKGDDAQVVFHLTLTDSLSNRITQCEKVQLKRFITPGAVRWKVVPGQPEMVVADATSGIVLNLATLLAHPRRMLSLCHAEVSRSNLKELVVGLIRLTHDYDEKYAVETEKLKDKLLPYLLLEQFLYSPADSSGEISYSFNDKLTGVKADMVGHRKNIVLMYEGPKGQLAFRHDGRALVAFTNGVVKFVTKEEANLLRWEP